jgi:predicted transcriptional regulator
MGKITTYKGLIKSLKKRFRVKVYQLENSKEKRIEIGSTFTLFYNDRYAIQFEEISEVDLPFEGKRLKKSVIINSYSEPQEVISCITHFFKRQTELAKKLRNNKG